MERQFNRERYLYYLLGAVLAYQGLLFGYGLIKCTSPGAAPNGGCPNIGDRFEKFSQSTTGAVLGLLAGSALSSSSSSGTSAKKKREETPTVDNTQKIC